MGDIISINEHLSATVNDLRVNALNFNLDNAIDSLLLFYTGYYDTLNEKESNTGYCDIVASSAINFINENILEPEDKEEIKALILASFSRYKEKIRNIITEMLTPIKERIANGDVIDEESLRNTAEEIVKEASNCYQNLIKDLLNEINITDNNETIRNYFYQDVLKKTIGVLEDKIYCTMGVTNNSFNESNARIEKINATNEGIVASVKKAA